METFYTKNSIGVKYSITIIFSYKHKYSSWSPLGHCGHDLALSPDSPPTLCFIQHDFIYAKHKFCANKIECIKQRRGEPGGLDINHHPQERLFTDDSTEVSNKADCALTLQSVLHPDQIRLACYLPRSDPYTCKVAVEAEPMQSHERHKQMPPPSLYIPPQWHSSSRPIVHSGSQ